MESDMPTISFGDSGKQRKSESKKRVNYAGQDKNGSGNAVNPECDTDPAGVSPGVLNVFFIEMADIRGRAISIYHAPVKKIPGNY